MDADTRTDVALLHAGATPCSSTAPGEKCEACAGGCEPLESILNGTVDNHTTCRVVLPWAERTHYTLPRPAPTWGGGGVTKETSGGAEEGAGAGGGRGVATGSAGSGGDILLYRTTQRKLCYSYRPPLPLPLPLPLSLPLQSHGANIDDTAAPTPGTSAASAAAAPPAWSVPQPAGFTDVDTNLNAGALPAGGGIYLLHNPVLTSPRNPLVLSLSEDGIDFNRAFALANCFLPPYSNPGQPNGCSLRHPGKGHAPGPQYPQGIVVEENGVTLFVATFSNNKEDIWVTSTPLSVLTTN